MARKNKSTQGRRSGYEDEVFNFLDSTRAKEVQYETFLIPYTIPETKANYKPDYLVLKKNKKDLTNPENYIMLEVKGRLTLADRKKMKLVKKSNPELDIRFVFQSDNYLTSLTPRQKKLKKEKIPFKKDRYSDWAEKLGFKWCIGPEIPKEWIKEMK